MNEKCGARTVRPNDLFALQYVHDARLSSDGRRVAYVISRIRPETSDELLEVILQEFATGTRRRVEFAGRATFPRWSPDGVHLAFVGVVDTSSRLYRARWDEQGCTPISPEGLRVLGPPSWSPDGRSIAYSVLVHHKRDGMRRITRRVFRADELGYIDDLTIGIHITDIAGCDTRRLEFTPSIASQPIFSPCGKRILFLGTDTAVSYPGLGGLALFTFDLADGRAFQVLGDGWYIAAARWSPCGERIVVVGDYESPLTIPTTGLWVVDRDGSDPQCRTEGFVGNVGLRVHHDMPTWDTSQNSNTLVVPSADVAYATVATRGCTEIWKIALQGTPRCEPAVSGRRSCVVMDMCPTNSQLVFCATDLHRPWELHQVDLMTGKERRLTLLNDKVMADWPALGVTHLNFESVDGVALEGWFLKRVDRSGPQPTVMFIHGGPFLATGQAFRFDFHLLAANGYAVVFANFRGSAGYGEPFARAIMGDWGARGFPDHLATVDAAIAHGLADGTRLGAWGPSHGGLATAWIIGHTSRFKAAVVESATTNWLTKYYLSDATDWIVKDLGGTPEDIPDVYRSRSPLTYARSCRTPTLLLHGEEDARCPIQEAEQFYRALHDAGCTTEFVRIPGMTHMGDSIGPLAAREAPERGAARLV